MTQTQHRYVWKGISLPGLVTSLLKKLRSKALRPPTSSAHEKTKRELQEARGHFNALFQHSPMATQMISRDGKILHVNKAWFNMWQVEEIQLEDNFDSYSMLQDPQLEILGVKKYIIQALNGEPVQIPEVVYNPADNQLPGRLRRLKCWAYPLYDHQGEVTAAILKFLDVTDFRINEERLHHTIDSTHIGIWDWDILQNKSICSQRCYDLLGLSSHDVEAAKKNPLLYQQLLDVEVVQELQRDLRTIMSTGQLLHKIIPINLHQGPKRWLEIFGQVFFHNQKAVRILGSIRDISAEMQIKKELESGLERLRLCQQVAHISSWECEILTMDITWQEVNPRMAESTPRNLAQLKSQIYFEDIEYVDNAIQAALEGKQDLLVEFRYVHPITKKIKWLESRGRAFFNNAGVAERMVGINLDISARKSAEEQLKREQTRIQIAHEGAKIVFWTLDLQTLHTNWFGAYEHVYGKKIPQELPGEVWMQSLHPADSSKVKENYQRALDLHEQLNIEFRYYWPDGTLHWLMSIGNLQYDRNGHPTSMVGISMDITKRKELESSLISTETRAQLAVEVAHLGVWEYDFITQNSVCNERFGEIVGLNKGEVPNWETIFKRIHPDDQGRAVSCARTALSSESDGAFFMHCRILKDKGAITWVFSQGKFFFSTKDNKRFPALILGATQDITLEMQNKEMLTHAKILAETANKAKSTFLANMGHEIRTPLSSIIGYTELLLEEWNENRRGHVTPQHTQDILSSLTIIKRNGHLLMDLVNDLLDLSKIEAGQISLEYETVNLRDLLNDIHSIMQLKAHEKGIEFFIFIEGKIPSSITTDSMRLKQILINVVGNAIKFTNIGKITVTVKMEKLLKPKLLFMVQDSGIGISGKQLKKLFRPFVQADPSLTRRFGGTGLGLALSKKLAQALGGDVNLVSSNLGEGSLFAISIAPQFLEGTFLLEVGNHLTPPEVSDEAISKIPKGVGPLHNFQILLAEDAPEIQHLISIRLQKEGAQVLLANDGQEAVTMAKSHHPHVIIMDLQMPRMNGHQALQRLRCFLPSTPVIALTAHALIQEKERCLKAGFNDYLTKPVVFDDLVSKILLLGSATIPTIPSTVVPENTNFFNQLHHDI